jgi:hypothetical protein
VGKLSAAAAADDTIMFYCNRERRSSLAQQSLQSDKKSWENLSSFRVAIDAKYRLPQALKQNGKEMTVVLHQGQEELVSCSSDYSTRWMAFK